MANNKNFNFDKVIADMKQYWPSKYCDHEKVAKKYYKEVKQAIIKGIHIADVEQTKFNLIPINFSELRVKVGRYGNKGKQKYWFDWFQEHHPLMTKVSQGYKLGNKGILTMIKLTKEIELMLSEKDDAGVFRAYYENEVDTPMDWVDIDLNSLDAYIRHNLDSQRYNSRSSSYSATLKQNLQEANQIYSIASFTEGQLPQIISLSKFGRKYYRGVNLQSASKMVRHAALGDCYQYDIEASVFTWKLDLAKDIDPTIKLPATIDYLDFKNHHRQRLAELLFDRSERSVKTIKRVITAVGFGARMTNTVYRLETGEWQTTALKNIIVDPTRLKMLFDDSWFKEFVAEQDKMTALIYQQVKDRDNIKNMDFLKTPIGRLSKSKVMSYLYQQTEAMIIQALQTRMDTNGTKCLLVCHDGFYTKTRADVVDLRYELQQYLPHGKLEEVRHDAFKYNPDAVIEEQEHKQWIRDEERRVAQTLGKSVHVPQAMYVPKYGIKNEDYDNGYDDGSRAYEEPEYDYDEDEDEDQ